MVSDLRARSTDDQICPYSRARDCLANPPTCSPGFHTYIE